MQRREGALGLSSEKSSEAVVVASRGSPVELMGDEQVC
jgi:hypothetical protein